VKKNQPDGLVTGIERMATSTRAMLRGKSGVLEVVVARGDGISFRNGGVEMVVVTRYDLRFQTHTSQPSFISKGSPHDWLWINIFKTAVGDAAARSHLTCDLAFEQW
jgi:hypothetical protein